MIRAVIPNVTNFIYGGYFQNPEDPLNLILSTSGGVNARIFGDIIYALDLEYKIIVSKNGGWVIPGPQGGDLAGMALDILDEDADVSIGLSENLPYRVCGGLKFLHPNYAKKLVGIYRKHSSFSDILLKPFDAPLWISILLFGIIYLLILFRNNLKRPFKSFLLIFNLFFFILFSIYSGTIVSYLSVDQMSFKTFSEMKSSHTPIYGDSLTQSTHELATSEILGVKELAPILQKEQDFIWISLLENFYRYFLDSGYSSTFLCEQFDVLTLQGEYAVKAGFFVKKGSHLKEPFNQIIAKMMQTGLNFRYMNSYMEEEGVPRCSKRSRVKWKGAKVNVGHLRSAFYILIGFYALAIGFLAFEVHIFKKSIKNKLFLKNIGKIN